MPQTQSCGDFKGRTIGEKTSTEKETKVNIDKHRVHLVYLTWDKVSHGEPLSEDLYFELIAEGFVPEQLILLFREGYTPGQIMRLPVEEEPSFEDAEEETVRIKQALSDEDYEDEDCDMDCDGPVIYRVRIVLSELTEDS